MVQKEIQGGPVFSVFRCPLSVFRFLFSVVRFPFFVEGLGLKDIIPDFS